MLSSKKVRIFSILTLEFMNGICGLSIVMIRFNILFCAFSLDCESLFKIGGILSNSNEKSMGSII